MVKYLKFENQEIPIRVGYSSLVAVKEKHKKDLSKITDDDLDVYVTLMTQALKSGQRATKGTLEITEELVMDLLDECFMDFVEMIPAFFPDPPKKPTRGKK